METDIAQYDTTSNGGGVIIFRPFWFPWWPIGGQDASQIFDVRNFLRILYLWYVYLWYMSMYFSAIFHLWNGESPAWFIVLYNIRFLPHFIFITSPNNFFPMPNLCRKKRYNEKKINLTGHDMLFNLLRI